MDLVVGPFEGFKLSSRLTPNVSLRMANGFDGSRHLRISC